VPRRAAGVEQVVAEVAEFVSGCRSPQQLWSGVADCLQTHLPFDSGWVGTTTGTTADMQGAIVQHDPQHLRANLGRYLGEITPPELGAYITQARRHDDVWGPSRRSRMSIFREVLDPAGVTHMIVRGSMRETTLLGFNLERHGGSPFSERDLRLVDAIGPICHLGDIITRTGGDQEAWRTWALQHGLSKRESEVTGLVVKGLRNAEIARLLTVSTLTVRNTLVKVFRKTGVAGRTELAYEAMQPDGAGVQERRVEADHLAAFFTRARGLTTSARLAWPAGRNASIVLAEGR
jgi:DNA-binding CsgD family transcriptional regulator